MIGVVADWLKTIRELGEAFLEVLRAEVDALTADLKASGRLAVRGARLIVVALILAFWCVGILLLALVALLAQSLGLWQSAALVAGLLLLATVGVILRARWTLRQVRGPVQTAKTHLRDHVDWVKGELSQGETVGDEDSESG